MSRRRKALRETPVDLELWLMNGCVMTGNSLPDSTRRRKRTANYPRVSVGRTESRRRLGFAVKMSARAPWMLFTFDRVQLTNLRDHFEYQLARLKR